MSAATGAAAGVMSPGYGGAVATATIARMLASQMAYRAGLFFVSNVGQQMAFGGKCNDKSISLSDAAMRAAISAALMGATTGKSLQTIEANLLRNSPEGSKLISMPQWWNKSVVANGWGSDITNEVVNAIVKGARAAPMVAASNGSSRALAKAAGKDALNCMCSP